MRYPEYVDHPAEEPYPQPERNKPILASLLLQQALYYNAFFDLPYALIQILLFAWKYKNTTKPLARYVPLAVLILFIILEPVRLLIGWRGNLLEQAPQILAFLFMSCFLSVALVVFYSYGQSHITGLDKAMAWIYLALVILQVFGGLSLLIKLVRHRTARFAVEQFVMKDNSPQYHPGISTQRHAGSHLDTEMALLQRPRPIVPSQGPTTRTRT